MPATNNNNKAKAAIKAHAWLWEKAHVLYVRSNEGRRHIYSTFHRDGGRVCVKVADPYWSVDAFNRDAEALSILPKYWVDYRYLLENCKLPEDLIVVDLETAGFDPFAEGARITRCGTFDGHCHRLTTLPPYFTNPTIKTLIGHNIKFDIGWMLAFGILDEKSLDNLKLIDTLTLAYLHDCRKTVSKDLASLTLRHTNLLNYWLRAPYDDIIHKPDLTEGERLRIDDYLMGDLRATKALYDKLYEPKWKKLINYESEKLKLLAKLEHRGMEIDVAALHSTMNSYKKKMASLKRKLTTHAKKEGFPQFNPASPKQLVNYLFYHKDYTPHTYTKTGQPGTDKESLEKLAEKHTDDPVLQHLDEWRRYEKIYTTYFEPIKNQLDNQGDDVKGNRVRCNFNPAVAETNRLSSSDPNFQNIPEKAGKDVKKLFISRWGEDGCIIDIDYSQLEIAVLADLSRDKNMIEALRKGESLHDTTSQMLNIPRHEAKSLNFKLIYGGGSQEERDQWFEAYPEAKAYMSWCVEYFERTHYAPPLITGFRRYIGEPSSDKRILSHQRRQAMNTPVQGNAGNITLIAAGLLDKKLAATEGLIVNTVHDSVVVDASRGHIGAIKNYIYDAFTDEVTGFLQDVFNWEMKVPLSVDIKMGYNWGEKEEI